MADSPAQISYTFPFQSYFDSTLNDAAVQAQGVGKMMVDTAAAPAQDVDTPGYGLALDPSSEAPVAVTFKGGSSGESSATILRPGQMIIPFGRGGQDRFSGFRFGLPFGWLGGGLVTLLVLRSPGCEIDWPVARRPVIIQRQTLDIYPKTQDITTLLGSGLNPNWPLRFPGTGTRAASGKSQASSPYLSAEPVMTIVRLVPPAALANPSTVRFLFFETKEFDLDNAQAPVLAPVAFEDVTFQSYNAAGAAGPVQTPLITHTSGGLVSLGIDPLSGPQTNMGVVAIDLGDGSDLSTSVVQVVRYGRI